MKPVVLRAHYDGRVIRLDEPYDIPRGAKLVVTIVPAALAREGWKELAKTSLARAYGAAEPDYPIEKVAEPPSE